MCAKVYPPDYQARRHEFTINLRHALDLEEDLTQDEHNALFKEAWDNWKLNLKDAVGVQWLGAALEYNKVGNLHVNAYVCWERQTRMMTKKAQAGAGCKKLHLPFGVSMRPVRMPDNLYDYVCGLGKHAGKPAEDRIQLGAYPSVESIAKHSLVDIAIADLMSGQTPNEIARKNPRAFFYHHRAIKALYEAWSLGDESPDRTLGDHDSDDGSPKHLDATTTGEPSQTSQTIDGKEIVRDG